MLHKSYPSTQDVQLRKMAGGDGGGGRDGGMTMCPLHWKATAWYFWTLLRWKVASSSQVSSIIVEFTFNSW